jgi:hypothetical protein
VRLFIVVALLGVAGIAPQIASASPATKRVLVEPFAGQSVAPRFHIVSITRGTCPSGAIASSRPDSLRCFTGNQIVDPCFRPPGGRDVGFALCFAGNPFGVRLLRVNLTQPLSPIEKHPARGAEFPFAVELASERTCFLATGALGVLDGKIPFYYCRGGGDLGNRVHETGTHWWAWFTAGYRHPHWVREAVRLAAF